jgi:hypothetical protein
VPFSRADEGIPLAQRELEALRSTDARVTPAQREYLDAFDLHLRAGSDATALAEAKRRTNAALVALNKSPRSVASRNWIDRLLGDMSRAWEGLERVL